MKTLEKTPEPHAENSASPPVFTEAPRQTDASNCGHTTQTTEHVAKLVARGFRLGIAVTRAEYEAFNALAKSKETTVSSWARSVLSKELEIGRSGRWKSD